MERGGELKRRGSSEGLSVLLGERGREVEDDNGEVEFEFEVEVEVEVEADGSCRCEGARIGTCLPKSTSSVPGSVDCSWAISASGMIDIPIWQAVGAPSSLSHLTLKTPLGASFVSPPTKCQFVKGGPVMKHPRPYPGIASGCVRKTTTSLRGWRG